jgi:hypothetical protein
MSDVTVTFDVVCDCGASLDTDVNMNWHGDSTVTVTPCPRCLDTADDAGYSRGFKEAEAEARRWEWVAKHTYVCPLGEMKPGEPGSYVIEVRPSDALLAHYEEAHG